MTATLDSAAADLQRANAELRRQLDECRAELAARNSAYSERIDHQAATVDVLKVMLASPGDPQPVFDLIVERARDLCDGYGVTVYEFDGTLIHWRTATGVSDDPSARQALEAMYPMAPTREFPSGRAILDRQVIHIRDMETEPWLSPAMRGLTVKSSVSVPLIGGGAAIGALVLGSRERGGFSDSQVELLKTFAEQAVIAITSAETYRQLQQRTGDLQESLEYQTATSDLLKVISRSTFDLQPVLDTLVETAARLCDAEMGLITSREGDAYRVAASFAGSPEYDASMRGRLLAVDRGTLTGRTALDGRVVHIADIASDPEYTQAESVSLGKIRTALGVPLLREGVVVGTINLARTRVQPYTERQIELVRTFADQAVIAIENTRLITETREALEQQTATAEVLQVINSSPGDLTPVFDAMLAKALELCGAGFGTLVTYDGEHFHIAAARGVPAAFAEFMRNNPVATFGPGTGPARILAGGRVIHILDLRDEDAYRNGDPHRVAMVDLGGARTAAAVALMKDSALRGFFVIYRQEVRPFSDKQIALLQNFAAQAVIAIENARLITETREALEQQTATAEVLQVINGSPGDLAPVFDAILEKAHSLCGIAQGSLELYDGERFRAVAVRGLSDAFADMLRQGYPASDNPATRPLIEGGRLTYIRDLAETDYSITRSAAETEAVRTLLCVPLRRDDALLGMIASARREVRPFAEKEIALLENFAAQAVIAMENARLLGELQQRTGDLQESLEYQTATSDVLKVISRSTFDLDAALRTVVTAAARLCRADHAGVYRNEGGEYRWAAGYNQSPEYEQVERAVRILPGPGTLVGRTADHCGPVQILDAEADPLYEAKEDARIGNIHSMLGVPLLREGSPIGVIGLARTRIEPFTEKQVELVSTFADQSVIAIENARLLNELRDRTDELTRSVAELQALEEVLRAVNSSLDLNTVLATIISRAVQLSQADEGTIYEFDETKEVFVPKSAFGMSAERVEGLRDRGIRIGETPLGRSAAMRAPLHIADLAQAPEAADVQELVEAGICSLLVVPLLREDKVIGGLVIRRRTVGGFAPTIPTLLQTFAGQAVLAIENARLFQELAARGEEARRARTAAEAALADLRRAQDRLIQAEKMASLGQLTAGIAHEIKNPLNFVNNFAGLSVELLDELKETAAPAVAQLGDDTRAEIDEIVGMLTGNLEKIAEHGRRADGIVKSMLEHSRGGTGERREVDLNRLVEEALNLAYHGARAQDQNFNITLERDFAKRVAPIELVPQDLTRVLLNLFGNGFYAATKRRRDGAEPDFRAALKVTTHDCVEAVEIRVRDNGTGIAPEIRDKLFQPFFTTKPTGEGTGLGLSISYDIVTQQHGGTIAVDSRLGEFTEFAIRLPRTSARPESQG